MIHMVLAGALLGVYTVYTVAAVASFGGPVDRALRARTWRHWSLRSMLPFWGLFAQKFGMFDIDISYRAAAGDDSVETAPWRPLTDNGWRWWSFLWRPAQRPDQVSQILALRIVAAGRLRGGDDVVGAHPAYRRVVAAVGSTVAATALSRTSLDGRHGQFRIRISHGHWTRVAPTVEFTSRVQPMPRIQSLPQTAVAWSDPAEPRVSPTAGGPADASSSEGSQARVGGC